MRILRFLKASCLAAAMFTGLASGASAHPLATTVAPMGGNLQVQPVWYGGYYGGYRPYYGGYYGYRPYYGGYYGYRPYYGGYYGYRPYYGGYYGYRPYYGGYYRPYYHWGY
jgi:hypothetical protein